MAQGLLSKNSNRSNRPTLLSATGQGIDREGAITISGKRGGGVCSSIFEVVTLPWRVVKARWEVDSAGCLGERKPSQRTWLIKFGANFVRSQNNLLD